MLNLLFTLILKIISLIADLVFTPIMLLINALVPGIITNLNNIFDFLQPVFNYIPFICKLVLIPSAMLNIVLSIFTIHISLTIGVRAYQFIMKLYNKFKP